MDASLPIGLDMIDFKTQAYTLREELIARRRDFHQHPELAFEEVRSSRIIAEELRELGLEVQTGVAKTGVVAILEGDADGPTVLYRADMDALPIKEENAVDYASQTPGVMHACGHDGHMAVALGVAKLMAQNREHIAGRIKFVFQPGEEGAGGALAMIDEGVLDDPQPDVSLGLHLWNPLPLGKIGVAKGAVMSGSSTFQLVIRGKGGHAALPYTAIDPVLCAGQLITSLHTLVGRKMDALAGAVVLSVTGVRTSSYAYNIIPEFVEVMGTFRTFNAYTSELLEQHIRAVSQAVCASVGCEVEVTVKHLTIPTVNHPDVVARVRRAFAHVVDSEMLDVGARTMASEDMSYLMDDIPGMYFFVGASNKQRGLDYGHHHPRFDFDEEVLPYAVMLMATAIADFVVRRDKSDEALEITGREMEEA
jgi:amidohydrolase